MAKSDRTHDDFAATGSRPPSLWPDTNRLSDFRSTTSFTRFDPIADERAREQAIAETTFDVCHPSLGLRAVLLVQAVFAVGALATATSGADWLSRQGTAAFAGAAGTVLWLVLVCSLRRWLRPRSAALRGGVMLALGGATALVVWLPLWFAGLADNGALRLVAVPLVGVGLAALLWTWLELRAHIWQPANANARLAELQSRIRPHFLFNALNTAVALVRVDPAKAETVLEDLAQLFRVALADVGASVSMDEEIDLARRYLEIEQVRYGERLQVSWRIDPRIGAARVPPLVLQPLVENAVRHGVEPSAGGSRIRIEGAARRGQAVLTVSNTVSDEPSTPGHGMALANVRERLRLLHDVAGECEVWREGREFHARVTVPI